jgi:hypothetical protein
VEGAAEGGSGKAAGKPKPPLHLPETTVYLVTLAVSTALRLGRLDLATELVTALVGTFHHTVPYHTIPWVRQQRSWTTTTPAIHNAFRPPATNRPTTNRLRAQAEPAHAGPAGGQGGLLPGPVLREGRQAVRAPPVAGGHAPHRLPAPRRDGPGHGAQPPPPQPPRRQPHRAGAFLFVALCACPSFAWPGQSFPALA